ncbi:MAG: histidine kinase [Actinomycetia bacterium]|nr:histidine kinase [Actinomycetes bacterium]
MSVEAVVTTAAIVIFGGIQLALCRGHDRPRTAYVLLVLGLLPLTWGVPSTALAYGYAAALVSFSAARAAVVIVVCGTFFAVAYRGGFTSVSLPMVLLELFIAAVVLTAITHLAVLGNRLRLARELLARRNVDLERERISRHLHDVLGRTLVAASLRNQTSLRTLDDRNPEVCAELQRLQETLATGQQRIRSVTSGPAISSWREEVSAARMLCQRVGIVLEADVADDPPAQHRALVGLAIREGVTNVLKHSRATRIDLTVEDRDGDTAIGVENDGVLPVSRDRATQSRLKNAIELASGTLTMGVTAEGQYRVDISLPAAEPASDGPSRLP